MGVPSDGATPRPPQCVSPNPVVVFPMVKEGCGDEVAGGVRSLSTLIFTGGETAVRLDELLLFFLKISDFPMVYNNVVSLAGFSLDLFPRSKRSN